MQLPEVIEVKPLVRRAADVVCESFHETLHEAPQVRISILSIEVHRIFELLEVKVVPVAAHVQPEAQDDRHLERRGKLPRRGREGRRSAEEVDVDHVVAGARSVDEERHDRALIERFLDRECGRRTFLTRVDDRRRELRIQGVQHARQRGILLEIEDDAKRHVLPERRHRAQRIEATHVSTEYEHAAAPTPALA
jgi:hypothetical protein